MIGCYRSHLHVVEDARYNRYRTILVLEDGADYIPHTDDWLSEFQKTFSQLPKTWKFFYLMACSFTKTKAWDVPERDRLRSGTDMLTTKAYCLSDRVFDELWRALSTRLAGDDIWPVDHVYGNVHITSGEAYVAKKALCFRIAMKSAITGTEDPEWHPQIEIHT